MPTENELSLQDAEMAILEAIHATENRFEQYGMAYQLREFIDDLLHHMIEVDRRVSDVQ